jgi:hypothetical protein
MKKIILATLTVIFTLGICFAQDVIIKKSGEDIQAKVLEVSQTEVMYKEFANQNGPTLTMLKSDVLMVRYENGTKDIFNNNGKKMGLCDFKLLAGSGTAAVGGLAGAIYDADKNAKDAPYYGRLNAELKNISENILKGSEFFQYIPSEKLLNSQSDKPIPMDISAKNNDIFACFSAKESLGVAVGWQKKVCMTTVWEITTAAGYKVKIKSYSVSEDKQGMFPDVGDPKLEPVWLELAKENANQFLEKLSEIMKKDKNLQ